MAEIPVIVPDNEVIVAGNVSEVNLFVDVGPEGVRGSIVFSGVGPPQPIPPTSLEDVFGNVSQFRPGDLYIDVGTLGYSWLYQYQNDPGGPVWRTIVKLNPSLYMTKRTIQVTSGASDTISIPLIDIVGSTVTTLLSDNFIVQATINSDTANIAYMTSSSSVSLNGANLDLKFNVRRMATTSLTSPTETLTFDITVGTGTIG